MLSARLAIRGVFFLHSLAFAGFLVRLPEVKAELGLTDADMGLCLLGAPVGMLVMLPFVGGIVTRFGSALVTRIGLVAFAASLILLTLAEGRSSLTLALAVVGAIAALVDVAMNASAHHVEEQGGGALMSSCHGSWSLGATAGALGGSLIIRFGLSWQEHQWISLVAVILCSLPLGGLLPKRADEKRHAEAAEEKQPVFALPRRGLIGLAFMVLFGMVLEGAVADWGAIFLRDELLALPAYAAWGLASFGIWMAATRFAGDYLAGRFSAPFTIRASGIIAGMGFATVLLTDSPVVALIGFALVGAGVAVVVPTGFRSAAQRPFGTPAANIAAVASISYIGFLVGPPLVGFISHYVGLRGALWVMFVFACVLFLLGGQARSMRRSEAGDALQPAAE
jgi:MFS family permease